MSANSIAPIRRFSPSAPLALCATVLAFCVALTAQAAELQKTSAYAQKTSRSTISRVSAAADVRSASTRESNTAQMRHVSDGALSTAELCAMLGANGGSNLYEPGGSPYGNATPCPQPQVGGLGNDASPPTGSGGETTPENPYAGVRAYDLFDEAGNDLDMLRSYLLAVASMSIYVPLDYEGSDFWGSLEDTMSAHGMTTEVIEDVPSDTQSAIFANDRVVILSFRGTESNSDRWSDLQNWFRMMPPHWGENVGVHNGFIASWETVRPRVITALKPHLDSGKELWITGHSLGGALATVAAYELEVVTHMDVEGVHTFGSPRVGNGFFKQEYDDSGLGNRTHRWQIEGDPIPSYFPFAFQLQCTLLPPQCSAVAFPLFHVGTTHDVLVSGASPNFDYELEAYADDDVLGWHLGGGFVEHVKYDDMFVQWLEDEADDALIEILPPLPVDEAPNE